MPETLKVWNEADALGGLESETDLLTQDADLATILNAWNDATQRLQQTHEVLQAEVRRLNDELAEKNRELARKNRLADLGHMAAHVAHEVRNSLVPVTLYLSLLKRRLAGDQGSLEILTKVEAGFTTLDTTVNDLLNFTSERAPQWDTVAVGQLIEEICEALGPQLGPGVGGTSGPRKEERRVRADHNGRHNGPIVSVGANGSRPGSPGASRDESS